MKVFWNKICRIFDKAAKKNVMAETKKTIEKEPEKNEGLEKKDVKVHIKDTDYKISTRVTKDGNENVIEIEVKDSEGHTQLVTKLTRSEINESFKKTLEQLKSGNKS
ncbi:hypothetical protein [Chryseobacterium mucoviscidosis]|uniref:hypothetical protein n=1 Tax=Chryseobacterium mucoviscidosis TaxID=1945581 RepID=UPI0031DFCA7E